MKSFEDCFALASLRNGHYSLSPERHRILYDALLPVFANLEPHRAKPVCLELGICHGRTAVLLMAMGFEYFGIDDFSLEGSWQDLERFMWDNGLGGTIIESRSQDAEWGVMCDVLLVDGGHDEDNVKPDCEKFPPFVRPGGLIIFDDYQDGVHAHWAVKKYADIATEGWERLTEDNGFLIARRPK